MTALAGGRPGAVAAAGGDFKAAEIAAALLVALFVEVSGVFLLRNTSNKEAAVAEIDVKQVAVKVKPVLDLDSPLLKLGGKRDKFKLPDRWVKQTPKPRVEEKAFVSTKADKTDENIPRDDLKMAEAGTDAPPPDAEIAKQVDTEIVLAPDAAAVANVDEEGHADGVREGTETDPLKARAVDLYRAKLISFFSSKFRVSGSGLSPEELRKYRVGATVQLGPERTVVGFTLRPSGNPAFDSAAQSLLSRIQASGTQLPPPPENYPDTLQNQLQLTFVCTEHTCD